MDEIGLACLAVVVLGLGGAALEQAQSLVGLLDELGGWPAIVDGDDLLAALAVRAVRVAACLHEIYLIN